MGDTVVALQGSQLKVLENPLLSWKGPRTQQTERLPQWQPQLGQQARKQQDAFQRLVSPSMSISMNPFPPPFSFWRQLVDSAEAGPEREREMVQQAPR